MIASNVAPGTASPYAVVASSTALRVDVFSPTSLTPIYSDSALSVPGNAVYTLFMLGDAAAPIPLLRTRSLSERARRRRRLPCDLSRSPTAPG